MPLGMIGLGGNLHLLKDRIMTKVSDENLVRVLSGEKMLMNWRCRLGWHRWTTWTHDPRTLNPMTFEASGTGLMHTTCADCNMMRLERPVSKTIKRSSI